MKIKREEVVYDGRFISVKKIYFDGQDGSSGVWEAVKRKTFGKIVAICAITKNKEIILEKAFRIPINSYIIELPAGLMDIRGENPEGAIKRELLEETGYKVLVADEMMIFFGKNAEKVCEPELESCEEIEVIKVPAERLFDFLKHSSKECAVDIKTFSLIPFLQNKGFI